MKPRLANAIADDTQTNWNGIIGALELRPRSAVHFDHVQVRQGMDPRHVRVDMLLRNDLLEISAFTAGRGLRVSMNSNAYLIDRERAVGLKAAGFSKVGISLDSDKAKLEKFIKENPNTIKAFLRGHVQAVRLAIEDMENDFPGRYDGRAHRQALARLGRVEESGEGRRFTTKNAVSQPRPGSSHSRNSEALAAKYNATVMSTIRMPLA